MQPCTANTEYSRYVPVKGIDGKGLNVVRFTCLFFYFIFNQPVEQHAFSELLICSGKEPQYDRFSACLQMKKWHYVTGGHNTPSCSS